MSKNKVKDFLYEKESYKIRGACFEAWNTFKGIFKEKVVENALRKELKERGLKTEAQKRISIYYKKEKVGVYVPDLIIDSKILMELKVKSFLTKEDERQFWYYLRGSDYKLGFLINFGSQKLEIKRRVYDRAREKYQRIVSVLFSVLSASIMVVGLLFGSSTNAQAPTSLGLGVSPQIFELDVFPGETITKRINLKNKSEVAMPIAVRVTDFTAAEDSGEMLFDESSQDPSFTSRKWFKIENPNFILEAGETEKVNLTISVPENAEPGGHYSVILFEPRLPSFYFKEGQVRAIPVVGVLFLFSVKIFTLEPQDQQKLEIVEFSLPKEQRMVGLENLISSLLGSVAEAAAEITIIKKSPSNFILRIKNNDIYHIKPFGKVLIYNIFGKKVGEAEVPQKTILPGKIRRFPVEFSPKIPKPLKWLPASVSNFLVQNFFIGKYQAKLVLEAKTPLSSKILKPDISVVSTFFSLPWKFWLTVFVVVGTLIFFITKYRKRIMLAIKTLMGR